MDGTAIEPQAPTPLEPAEERSWAMLAHLATLLNLVTGALGVVAAFIVYWTYRDRSRYVAYQSLQSGIFQLIFWVGGAILAAAAWVITTAGSTILLGLCCVPFSILVTAIPLGAIVYGIVGGVQCNQGEDFRYWLVGDWVTNKMAQ